MRLIRKKYCLHKIAISSENNKYSIPLNLTASYQNIGLQSNLVKDWVNGECYSNQIWVNYNDEVYELKNGISSCGQFDDCSKEIYFDQKEWNKLNFGKTNELIGQKNSVFGESRLTEFQLLCSTDNMGNTLHGIIDGDYTQYENGKLTMTYPYKPNTIINISTLDEPYLVNGEKKYKIFANILTDVIEDETDNTVTFTYYIGAILHLEDNKYVIENDSNSVNNSASAIRYTEKYQITIENELFFKNRNTWFEIKYKNLVPINTYTYQVSDTNNKTTSPIANLYYFDSATYNKIEVDKEYHNLGIVLDENLGISYPSNMTKEVSIERGVSNYYERHLILGNVKTFEALQQYSNGYFKIIDNNNL